MAAVLVAVLSVLAPGGWARAAGEDGPASLSQKDIDAWIAFRLDPTGWRYLYFDGDGAYFLSPTDKPWRTQTGTWRVTLREELFRPDSQGARSMVMQAEVDCDGRKLRLPGIQAFSGHNLKGERVVRDPIRDWVAPETPRESAQFDQLCAAAKAEGAAAAAQPAEPPAPASLGAADVRAWIERYIDLSGWRVVEAAPDGLNLVASDGASRTRDGLYQLWTRVEFFRPQAYPAGGPPARSARQRVELDCASQRWRIIEVDAFRRNNLQDPEPPFQAPGAPWMSAAAGGAEPGMIRELCEVAKAAVPPPHASASPPARAARPAPARATPRRASRRTTLLLEAVQQPAEGRDVHRASTSQARGRKAAGGDAHHAEAKCGSRRSPVLVGPGPAGLRLRGSAGAERPARTGEGCVRRPHHSRNRAPS